MMVLGTFLEAIASLLSSVITLYTWIIIIAALITWVKPDPYNPIVQILYKLTEPAYALIRRVIPTNFNGFDFAPIILLLALQFINAFFVKLLYNYAMTMG